MWGALGFYLMVGILFLYLTDRDKGGIGWDGKQAAALVGSYMALVYFTPFIGGLVADRLLGCRKTIVIGAVLMMAGYFCLAFPGKVMLFVALGLIILGNGAFKPNISTLLGNLYPPGSKLRNAGYNIFYMGINIGAFVCNFVAALVRNYFDKNPLPLTAGWTLTGWHAAFATAGVGMLLGLVIFLFNYRGLAKADPDPGADARRESLQPLFVQCLAPAVAFGAAAYLIVDRLNSAGTIQFNPVTAAFFAACLPSSSFTSSSAQSAGPRGPGTGPGPVDHLRGGHHFLDGLRPEHHRPDGVDAHNTNREPGPVAGMVTQRLEDFAEDASPAYFKNAGPEVPRRARHLPGRQRREI